jgi:hypothetical protein
MIQAGRRRRRIHLIPPIQSIVSNLLFREDDETSREFTADPRIKA